MKMLKEGLIVDHRTCRTGAKYENINEPFGSVVPLKHMHHKHITGGSGPDAQFLCSAILSSFPRQMSRQTLHINRNLTQGLFHQPRCQQLLSKQYTTIQWLHTLHKHNTLPDLGGRRHIQMRKIKMPAVVNRLNNLQCLAEAIYRLNISHWPTILACYSYSICCF